MIKVSLSQPPMLIALRGWIKPVALLALLAMLAVCAAPAFAVPNTDFLAYWSAGRLGALGKDPYSLTNLVQVQRAVGWPYAWTSYLFWYPPWTLAAFIPLGLLPYAISRALWLAFSAAVIVFAARVLWQLYEGPREARWVALASGLSLGPLVVGLLEGQVFPVILLGIVGFLYWEKREKWFLAGCAASLISAKPQLLYLFWPGLLCWAVSRRRWTVLLGAGLATLLQMGIVALPNPNLLTEYAHGMSQLLPFYGNSLGLGSAIRVWLAPDQLWLQSIPMAAGIIWFAFYWPRHQASWQWREQMPLLILVSLVFAASAWIHDQAVFLIPVIYIASRCWRGTVLPKARIAILLGYLAVSAAGLAYFLPFVYYHQVWCLWMPAAFLLWYVKAKRAAVVAVPTPILLQR